MKSTNIVFSSSFHSAITLRWTQNLSIYPKLLSYKQVLGYFEDGCTLNAILHNQWVSSARLSTKRKNTVHQQFIRVNPRMSDVSHRIGTAQARRPRQKYPSHTQPEGLWKISPGHVTLLSPPHGPNSRGSVLWACFHLRWCHRCCWTLQYPHLQSAIEWMSHTLVTNKCLNRGHLCIVHNNCSF